MRRGGVVTENAGGRFSWLGVRGVNARMAKLLNFPGEDRTGRRAGVGTGFSKQSVASGGRWSADFSPLGKRR